MIIHANRMRTRRLAARGILPLAGINQKT